MDKILTLNTIKNVFSALGAKTSDSNYAVGLFDKTSGEPKGIMAMANLASVLGGVPTKYSSGSAADLNNYNTYASAGGYTVTSDTANRPTGLNNGVCIVMAREGNRITQTCLDLTGSAIYRRSYWGSWTDWQQVYDTSLLTNSALLSPLASALGGASWTKEQDIAPNGTITIGRDAYRPVVVREISVEGASALLLGEYSANSFTAYKSPKFDQVLSVSMATGGAFTITNISNKTTTIYYHTI